MSNHQQYPKKVTYQIATIASSGTTSDIIKCHGCTLVAIALPSLFEGTQIQFDVSVDAGSSFKRLYDKNNQPTEYLVSNARAYHLEYSDFAGVDEIKIVSNATESAEREIQVKLIP